MDNWVEMKDNEFIKVNISISRCTDKLPVAETVFKNADKIEIHTSTTKPPLLKNLLGENVFKGLQEWFGTSESKNVDDVKPVIEARDPCHIVYSHEVSFGPRVLLTTILAFLLTLIVIFISVYCVTKLFKFLHSCSKNDNVQRTSENVTMATEEYVENDKVENEVLSEESTVDYSNSQSVSYLHKEKTKQKQHAGSTLVCQGEIGNQLSSEKGTEAFTFLEKTSDKLFKKLDKLLLKGMADGQTVTQNCQSTSRPSRRSLQRRQRTGSSPMLASMVDSVENGQEELENNAQEAAWIDFKIFSGYLQWKYPCRKLKDPITYPPNVEKLLHYFQRVCPIPQNAWKTATLITNYVLYLISLEMTNIRSKSGYRFIEFIGTGSVKYGTKVSKCNQYDVLMMLQPPVIPDSVIGHSVDKIPPGMVVIGCKSDKTQMSKKVLSTLHINDELHLQCLSSKECLLSAEYLLEECLHSLYTNTRSALDRLPFQIKGAPTGSLFIKINTRALVGFGEPEIRINLVPVLRLPVNGLYQTPILYATPPILESEVSQREHTSMSYGINNDYLWKIETSDFVSVFYEEYNSLLKHAGVDSCHLICLMIIKCLLTGCMKNSIVDRGIFPATHLQAVINFLLLESSPSQWKFECLADRFSDAIHFIQSAYESSRLPEFFISNPHLINKMPSAANNDILAQKRQKNMLTDTSREVLEKRLDYLKMRLRESGLKDCVKQEFSSDMWEFEFFLFN
ncbi:hypothetical protein ACF0H5_013522 [Mactra antiquata]